MRALRLLALLSLALAGRADDEVDALDAALSGESSSVEAHLLSFARLRAKFGTAQALFDHYNRFRDVSKSTGEQALGTLEVRALLKDVGLGSLVLGGELAGAAIAATDSSGDGKVGLDELEAALGLAGCWLGDGADDEAILAPGRRAVRRVLEAVAGEPGALKLAIEREAHACRAVGAWWASGWASKLAAAEAASLPAPLRLPAEQCAAGLADELLAAESRLGLGKLGLKGKEGKEGKKGKKEGASGTAIRSVLKARGVEPLLARHLAAKAAIEALDADGDRRLSRAEIEPIAAHACRIYGAILSRDTTLSAAVRAISLPAAEGGFTPAAFAKLLGAEGSPPPRTGAGGALQIATLIRARRAMAEPSDDPLPPDGVDGVAQGAALIEAYVRLAPKESLGGAKAAKRDEL